MFRSDANNVDAVVAEIIAQLRELSDLSTQRVRSLRRQFSRHLANSEPQVVIEIGRRLVGEGSFYCRFVAYELISHHRKALRSLRKNDLLGLANTLDSWAAVDTFALYLAGPCWREHQVPDSLIESWAKSK